MQLRLTKKFGHKPNNASTKLIKQFKVQLDVEINQDDSNYIGATLFEHTYIIENNKPKNHKYNILDKIDDELPSNTDETKIIHVIQQFIISHLPNHSWLDELDLTFNGR